MNRATAIELIIVVYLAHLMAFLDVHSSDILSQDYNLPLVSLITANHLVVVIFIMVSVGHFPIFI